MKKPTKEQRKKDLELMNKICGKSKLTKRDIKIIANKTKKSAAKKFFEYCSKINPKIPK